MLQTTHHESTNLKLGSVPNALTLEGATRVYVEAHVGMHVRKLASVAVLALHDRVLAGTDTYEFNDNFYHAQLTDAGVAVSSLQRTYDPREGLAPYTTQDLEQIDAFLQGKQAGTALDPLSLHALLHLDPATLPPLILNMYRTADNTPDDVKNLMRAALNMGVVAGFTVDSDTALHTFRQEGFSEGEVQVIHNGTDLGKFHFTKERRDTTRRDLAIPDDAPLLMTVSRWDPANDEKDVPLFLKSAAHFLRGNPDAHIAMVGPGLTIENGEFQALLLNEFEDNHDLMSRLHAVGLVEIQNFYPAADVVVATPREDSRPLYIGEAFASGVPVVVSTDAGDARQIIGQNGFITEERDPEVIAAVWKEAYEKRHELAFDPGKREDLGQDRMVREYARAIHALTSS